MERTNRKRRRRIGRINTLEKGGRKNNNKSHVLHCFDSQLFVAGENRILDPAITKGTYRGVNLPWSTTHSQADRILREIMGLFWSSR